MSVTFQCFDAPRKQVPCPFCAEWLEKGWIAEGERCDQWCTGTTEESEAPEVNFANSSAVATLHILGWTDPEDYLGGQCDGATLRQRILKARNIDRSHLVVDPSITPGGYAGTVVVEGEDGLPTIQRMGPTIIGCGNTDEQTLRRLDDLEALALWAQENDAKITWG